MATLDANAHISQSVEPDAPPVASSSEAMALDGHLNGTAMRENSIDEFAVNNDLSIGKQPSVAPSSSNHEPVSDTTIEPVANYLSEMTSSDHAPNSAPAKQDESAVEQVNGTTSDPYDPSSSAIIAPITTEPGAEQRALDDVPPTSPRFVNKTDQDPQQPEVDSFAPQIEVQDQEMEDAPVVGTKIAREREDDEDDGLERSFKRAKTEDRTLSSEHTGLASPGASVIPSTELPVASDTVPLPPISAAAIATSGAGATVQNGTSKPTMSSVEDFGPMSDIQNRVLVDGMKNIKKSRAAAAYNNPVDPVALMIPHYLDVIKKPMDLRTMEAKLKTRAYRSVNEYVDDFDTMVQNSVTFNGPQHVVSQHGASLRALLSAQLKRVPKSGEASAVEPPKKQRKSSVSMPRDTKPRVPRSPAGPPPVQAPPAPPAPPAPTAPETFALDHDGMPQIRRHSTLPDGRPKREIHRPPPRDLPYSAKPKRKKYQQELKFCQNVLDDITRPVYQTSIALPFMQPVDPVALNIPTYRNIIKKPMDLSTVRAKLDKGEYENAKEFEADVKVIFANCYKFNGKEHPVSTSASQLEDIFDKQWAKKSDWLAKHAPASTAQSPEVDSQSEEEEEEEDDEEAERAEALKAINRQFAELSGQLLALQSQPAKRAKTVTKKSSKPGKAGAAPARRKSGSMSGAAALPIRSDKKAKLKQTKSKPITEAQKSEISEGIGLLTSEEMTHAADIIKRSLRKIGRADLADRGNDEMEFEIDQIPDEALHELLKLVRKNGPPAAKSEEVEYRPTSTSKSQPAANQGKARKNKPMKGAEQEAQIERVRAQLAGFQEAGGHAGSAIATEGQESSDDESDSGSESEEE